MKKVKFIDNKITMGKLNNLKTQNPENLSNYKEQNKFIKNPILCIDGDKETVLSNHKRSLSPVLKILIKMKSLKKKKILIIIKIKKLLKVKMPLLYMIKRKI